MQTEYMTCDIDDPNTGIDNGIIVASGPDVTLWLPDDFITVFESFIATSVAPTPTITGPTSTSATSVTSDTTTPLHMALVAFRGYPDPLGDSADSTYFQWWVYNVPNGAYTPGIPLSDGKYCRGYESVFNTDNIAISGFSTDFDLFYFDLSSDLTSCIYHTGPSNSSGLIECIERDIECYFDNPDNGFEEGTNGNSYSCSNLNGDIVTIEVYCPFS